MSTELSTFQRVSLAAAAAAIIFCGRATIASAQAVPPSYAFYTSTEWGGFIPDSNCPTQYFGCASGSSLGLTTGHTLNYIPHDIALVTGFDASTGHVTATDECIYISAGNHCPTDLDTYASTAVDGEYVVIYGSTPGVIAYGYVFFNVSAGVVTSVFDGPTVSSGGVGIIATVPVSGSTVSTTTPVIVGATVSIPASAYQSGDYLHIHIEHVYQSISSIGAGQLTYPVLNYDFPSLTAGVVSFSTTTPLLYVGTYSMTVTYTQPTFFSAIQAFLGQQGQGAIVYSTTTTFVADSQLPGDISALAARTFITQSAASTTLLASCNPVTFSALGCIYAITAPDPVGLRSIYNSFQNGFLAVAPWGVATRFVVIIYTAVPVTLPDFIVHTPTFLGGMPSYTVNLTPWNSLLGTSSMLSTATNPDTGHTIRDIVEPGWDDFVYFIFILYMASQVLGIAIGQEGANARGEREKSRHERISERRDSMNGRWVSKE